MGLPSSRTVGRRFDNNQTMLLCRRLRGWHGASLPSYTGSPALLGPLECSDWQLVQVLVDACHLVSSQASLRHLHFVNVPPVGAFCRSRDYLATATETHRSIDLVPGSIASFSWNLDLFLSFLAPW